ncbi:hypothetical protein ACI6Q2_06270 [Chitinophagaceae bacterium LWZ2-11]
MKNRLLTLGLVLVLGLGFAVNASAQHIYVSIQPTAPVIVRPAPPSPRHIWVETEWVARGGTYVAVNGHWATPPHRYHTWVVGRWVHEPNHGHYWVPGHWA